MILNHNQIYNLIYINSTSEYKGILTNPEERLLLVQLISCLDKVTSPYKRHCLYDKQDDLLHVLSQNLEADIFKINKRNT